MEGERNKEDIPVVCVPDMCEVDFAMGLLSGRPMPHSTTQNLSSLSMILRPEDDSVVCLKYLSPCRVLKHLECNIHSHDSLDNTATDLTVTFTGFQYLPKELQTVHLQAALDSGIEIGVVLWDGWCHTVREKLQIVTRTA